MIYIPIWLDLLLYLFELVYPCLNNLHSNMVRFIIEDGHQKRSVRIKFTFQYG